MTSHIHNRKQRQKASQLDRLSPIQEILVVSEYSCERQNADNEKPRIIIQIMITEKPVDVLVKWSSFAISIRP